MRFLSLLMVLLCLLVVGCSDDTETTKDGGADAIVEAGTDAVGDLPTEGNPPDLDAVADGGGPAQDGVHDSASEGGADQ